MFHVAQTKKQGKKVLWFKISESLFSEDLQLISEQSIL
jgi:hypothetical protein